MNPDLLQVYFLSLDKGFIVAAYMAGIVTCALFVIIVEAFSKRQPTTPYERREMPKPKSASDIKKALMKLQTGKKKK